MQQRLDWILKFVFLSARFDNIFTKAQNIYIYLRLQGRGTSSLQLAATAKIGRAPSKNLAISRVRVAGPQKGRRGQVRTEEAELAMTTSFLRRTLSVVGVRAQAKLLLGRLEVIGPGAGAAAGRRNYSLNLERIWANQRRADQLSRLQGKSLLRRGHFKID